MRRSPRKASLFLAVMTLWLRVGLLGLRRGAAPTLIVSFPKQTYRIGEAANPGPFSEGGASSSTTVAPFGMSSSRSVDQAAVGATPASGVAIGHEAEESRAAAMRRATGAGFSSFDDPGGWTFAEEHDASEELPYPVFPLQCCPSPELDAVVAEPEDHWARVTREFMKSVSDPSSALAPSKWAYLGTEADRAAARAKQAMVAPAHMPAPLPLESYSPAQALERRRAIMEQVRVERAEARRSGRQLRTMQEISCSRPRRQRDGQVLVGTVNGNSFATVREELCHGQVLPQAHYIALQEHLCRGEACDRASRDAAAAGWDAILTDAYIKESAPGGGTAILARQGRGAVAVLFRRDCAQGWRADVLLRTWIFWEE